MKQKQTNKEENKTKRKKDNDTSKTITSVTKEI